MIPFLSRLAEEDDVRSVADKYERFCNNKPLSNKTSTDFSAQDELQSPAEMGALKEKTQKTAEPLSEQNSLSKDSGEDYMFEAEYSVNYEASVDENLNSKRIRLTYDDFRPFEITKSKSEPTRKRQSFQTNGQGVLFSPTLTAKETKDLNDRESSMIDIETKIICESSEVLFSKADSREDIPASVPIKKLNSIFSNMRRVNFN